eukprot:CAMPEP_0202705888 /NCGR_PEP_ID=MMETSP1385-20130828/18389_1 /ASSEMBLY_ACC=CAM_ASM_000861 /TAXON_ID=933848 /ORGANISM="Elphidium margaritaceum" /LENGTH=387 /DNA_ID=CAMNT_0049364233 /DNA_START=29 /DNA_END=1189 /DNA_ORIENTATION=-
MALPNRPKPLKLKSVSSQSSSSQCLHWSNEEVVRWMQDVNDGLFAEYAPKALQLNINGSQLAILTANDLRTKFGITQANHVTTLLAAIQRLTRKKSDRRKWRSKTPEPFRPGRSPVGIPSISSLDLDDVPWPTERREATIKSPKFEALENSKSVPFDASHAVATTEHINFSPKTKVQRKSTMATMRTHSKSKPQKVIAVSLSQASKNAKSMRSLNTHQKARSMFSRSALKKRSGTAHTDHRKSAQSHNNTRSLGRSGATRRAYTVAVDDDEKLDTAQLKRMLTAQNGYSSKKKNDSHKDLGKKLWPSETSTILKEGWMKKRGAKITAFKERWCVLRESGHLYYFERRPVNTTDQPQGFLDLNGALKVEYVEDNHPNTFKLSTKDRDW